MKNTILVIFFLVAYTGFSQTKKIHKSKPKSSIKVIKTITNFPFEVGDIIQTDVTYCWQKEYKVLWQNVIKDGTKVVLVKASVEDIKGDKMQIKIINIWSYYKDYQNCSNSFSDEPNDFIKYNEVELMIDQQYWVNPNRYLYWNKVD